MYELRNKRLSQGRDGNKDVSSLTNPCSMHETSVNALTFYSQCAFTSSLQDNRLSPFTEIFVDQGFYILCQVVGWDLYCMSIHDSDCGEAGGGGGDFIFSTHASD